MESGSSEEAGETGAVDAVEESRCSQVPSCNPTAL